MEGSFPTYINIRICVWKICIFGLQTMFLERKVTTKTSKKHHTGLETVTTAWPYPSVLPLTIKNPPFPRAASSWAEPTPQPSGRAADHYPPRVVVIFMPYRFFADDFFVQFRCELFWEPTKMPRQSQKGGVFLDMWIFLPKRQLEETEPHDSVWYKPIRTMYEKTTPNSNH